MVNGPNTTERSELETGVADYIAKNRTETDGIGWVSPTGLAESTSVLTGLPKEHLHEEYVKSIRIADVGCGSGVLTDALTEVYPESEIVGIEYAPSAYRTAQERFGPDNQATIIGGDAGEVLDEIDLFDFIYAVNMIQDTEEPVRILEQLSKSLEKDGVLAVTVPSEEATEIFPEFTHHDEKLDLPYMEMEDIRVDGETTTWKQYAFPEERFLEIANECGLQVLSHGELPADAKGLLYPMELLDDAERKSWAESLVQQQKSEPEAGPTVQLYVMHRQDS